MRALVTLYAGIFAVMALSNAIVPVLPSYASGTGFQSIIFSAYFFGAFLLTLPAGLLSDRWGKAPLMTIGLFLTVLSGTLFLVTPSPTATLFIRVIEGAGAGLFVASGLSYVNSMPGHTHMSGIFIGLLNSGLVAGLIISGWAIKYTGMVSAGIIIFTALAFLPFITSIVTKDEIRAVFLEMGSNEESLGKVLVRDIRRYFWLWFSSIVLIGITGAVTALYPEFSGSSPDNIGLQIAVMNGTTAIAVVLASRVEFAPVPTIRIAALLLAASVMVSYLTSFAFIAIGALAGVVMIAQLAFLADAGKEQGTFMGLFNTSSYLGMALLPFIAGYIAETLGFFAAFFVISLFALIVAATIGLCSRCKSEKICNQVN